ncbi:MAG TPA: FtsX-like permease family protein [Rhizomicrobium sp.]|nr:FtsX-like permease family protein [Rhizomicrobium sp.]
MKYFPLVWAAVMRKPTRAILTLLSVMLAFTLFGFTIGMNATFTKMQEEARADRIYSFARFGGGPGGGVPIALARQIEKVPGVSLVASNSGIGGYIQDPKNRVFVQMGDENVPKVMAEWPIAPAQWQALRDNRRGLLVSKKQAERWHLKAGDTLTIASPMIKKADGTNSWTFQVAAVTEDIGYMSQGYMFGNYDYLDKARPLSDQGKTNMFRTKIHDPSKAAEIAERIDNRFASSPIPLQSITEKAAFDVSNTGLDIATVDRDIALAGMFMVLFLTANGIAQAVRERFAEFATLKTIGFSDRGVIGLVFAEAALPCLLGAGLGIGLAAILSNVIPRFLPPGQGLPIPTMTVMVFVWAGLSAAAIAFVSAALPALRLKQMDIATALSGRT